MIPPSPPSGNKLKSFAGTTLEIREFKNQINQGAKF